MGGVAELIPRALRLPEPQRPGNPVMVVLTPESQATTRTDCPQYKKRAREDVIVQAGLKTKLKTLNKLGITIKLTFHPLILKFCC
jgi:hypothetical protein